MLITKNLVKFFINTTFTDSLGHKMLTLRAKNATMTSNYFISANIRQISLYA